MTPRLLEVIPLRFSTAETDQGPMLELRRASLTLRYDAEDEERVVWTRLEFAPVFAVRFTADPSVTAWMLEAYSKVCEVESSEWIRQIEAAAHEGHRALQRARHFVVYFDDVGCFEVVASDVEVVVEDGDRSLTPTD